MFFTYEILNNSLLVMETVTYSFNIWINNIFPSLFPFFIISNLLINYGFVELSSELLKPIFCKLFKINSKTSFVFILSLITGFPSNSKYTKELYLNNEISEYDANKILMFTHFSNPLFILGTIYSLLNNKNICYLIMFSQYFANIIIGLLIRNYHPNIDNSKISITKAINNMHNKRLNKKIGTVLFDSINNTINTLLLILGTVTTFLILTSLVNKLFNLNPLANAILSGLLELTQGLKYVSLLDINIFYKALLITQIISFGGLSVHTQIKSILSDTKIKYKPFLFSRILHVFISSILFIISFKIYSFYI